LVLLVEIANAQAVYVGCGTWQECTEWIIQLFSGDILSDELSIAQKRLDQNLLVTMKDEVRVPLSQLELLGFHRADGQSASLIGNKTASS
jgi:hypothetical protein